MRIPDLPADLIHRAADGDLASMDALLRAIEGGIFNLAVRMLGHREDAADASQEILLKVTTHLGGYRGEAAFSTWVYRIARNHLSNAATRMPEAPTVSLEAIGEKLEQGLGFGRAHAPEFDAGALRPEDKAEAVEVAVGCTQGMLMALDRDQRLAYLLDVVFGLPSEQAGEVLGIAPAAFRKRLSRARERLDGFMRRACGLVDAGAACRCHRQLPALRATRAAAPTADRLAPRQDERASAGLARIEFDRWHAFAEAAAVFRAHPDYRPPERLLGAIRDLLRQGGYLPPRPD